VDGKATKPDCVDTSCVGPRDDINVRCCRVRAKPRALGVAIFVRYSPVARGQRLPAPATYQQACYYEPDVCSSSDSQLQNALAPLPSALRRPLRLPLLQPGQRCPPTPGGPIETSAFGGAALGSGSEPVRPLGRVTAAGVGELEPTPTTSGWYSFKTLWFSAPSYQGPWIVRGGELGGTNPVVFGEQPAVSQLVVPPIQTLNGANGYREAPGGTYVRTPGCYAWQVDGVGFSYLIVFWAAITPD
jgi:hypothetical protein